MCVSGCGPRVIIRSAIFLGNVNDLVQLVILGKKRKRERKNGVIHKIQKAVDKSRHSLNYATFSHLVFYS